MPKRVYLKEFQHAYLTVKSAALWMREGKFNKAKPMLEAALRIYPTFANALYLYSECLKEEGSMARSLKLSEQARKLNQLFFEEGKGNLLKITKKIEELEKCAARYLPSIESSGGREWLNLIDPHLRQKDFDTCDHILQLFERVKKSDSEYGDENLSNIGVKYFELARYKESIGKHLLAVEKAPTDVMYHNNLSILYYAIGDYPKSMQHIGRTFELEPGRVKSFYIQSFILIKMGEVAEGVRKAEYASSLEPSETLFRMKVIINMLLFGCGQAGETRAKLRATAEMLQKGQKTKQYFSAEENFPAMISFLNDNFDSFQEGRITRQDWEEYVTLFDEYLIRGLRDKLNIKRRMSDLSNRIIDGLIKSEPQPNPISQLAPTTL